MNNTFANERITADSSFVSQIVAASNKIMSTVRRSESSCMLITTDAYNFIRQSGYDMSGWNFKIIDSVWG